MKSLAFALLGFALVSGLSYSSSSAQNQPSATFTARTELVTVPVVVDDKSGAHVNGLTKEDFEVQENGKTRPIAVFEEVKSPGNKLSRAGQPGIYTNAIATNGSAQRLTIFALDMVNTPFLDQGYARRQLLRYLANRLDSREPTALVAISGGGIRVLHDFSTDPSVLVTALKKVTGESPGVGGLDAREVADEVSTLNGLIGGAEPLAMMASRQAILVTLESFQHVAESFAGVPGRKSLIWATASFPFGLDPITGTILSPRVFFAGVTHDVGTGMDRTGGLPPPPSSTSIQSSDDLKSLEPIYQRTFQMLADAQISVYPVDARGLVVFFPGPDVSRIQGLSSFNQALFEASRETMVGFAEMTGGRAFYNRNDLDLAFKRAVDDSASYYMLGYYLDKNAKPGWHKLKVKLKKSGEQVRARNGFFVTAPDRQKEAGKLDLQMAMASPIDYTGVPLTVRWENAQPAGSKRKVHFALTFPPNSNIVDTSANNHVNLDVLLIARNSVGKPADQFSQRIETNLKPDGAQTFAKEGLNYGNDVMVPPGEYSVRFVVRDNLTGRLGTVTAPLRVSP
jgi:VWFA-related protein